MAIEYFPIHRATCTTLAEFYTLNEQLLMTVDTEAELPVVSVRDGNRCFAKDTLKLYIWKTNAWVSVGSASRLDELTAPTDVTTLNATTNVHGLLRKLDGLTTTFLRGDGTWAAPVAAAAWGSITGTLSTQTDLQTALDGKSGTGHNHDAAYEAKNANIQAHVASAHAPANAQKNSDILKAEIEAVLTGPITSHTHSGGSDPWTYVQVNGGADFTTSSATAVDVTGLAFTPSANTTYEFEALLMIRTATATVVPRAGLAWSTGGTDGVAMVDRAGATATAVYLVASGNINAALLGAGGGLLNATQSWPVKVYGMFRAGATPSGNVRIQLASETAGTVVRVVARSFLKYRTLAF